MVDHDLLIKIDTQLAELSKKVDEHHGEKTARWEALEQHKADKAQVDRQQADHEARIRALESLTWRGLGGLAVMQVVLTIGMVILQMVLRK